MRRLLFYIFRNIGFVGLFNFNFCERRVEVSYSFTLHLPNDFVNFFVCVFGLFRAAFVA